MGSDPYVPRRLNLEGEFKYRTNHYPQGPYYRLPFADYVIYLAGFFCSGLSLDLRGSGGVFSIRLRCHVSDDLDRTHIFVLPNQPCVAPNGLNSKIYGRRFFYPLQRLAALSINGLNRCRKRAFICGMLCLNDGYQLRSGHS